MEITTAKAAARKVVSDAADDLVDLSHRIHANPEIMFEEERSSRWVAEALGAGDFSVEFGVCDLPTSFVASAGAGPLTVAICAEYDALPGVGHACGHNVIAAAAVGAGLALAPLADDLGITVKVMGTPAEEGGGGKILMLERGAFAGVNTAMMVHPAPVESTHMPCLAVSHVDVHYTGKEAHASAFPEEGRNAADALKEEGYGNASVVFLYMGEEFDEALRPNLQKSLKPGSRIVSHRFKMGAWEPDKTLTIQGDDSNEYMIHLWTVKEKK